MHLSLTSTQVEAFRLALLATHSDNLIDLIFRLNLSLPLTAESSSAIDTAVRLGWVTDNSKPQLSSLGWMVADPLREYRLWLDRDRRIHGELDHALLAPECYADKSVLEVGCGFGCNLLSLGLQTHGNFVGVEPMAVYRQFTPLLAEREGVKVPDVRDGTGEAIPFENELFDIVMCYSSLQYMDIEKALNEMTRVLRPGGQLQIIGGTLSTYSAHVMRQLVQHPSPSTLLNGTRTIINTLSYQWLGRRLWKPASVFATAAPIYPTYSAMSRLIRAAGLALRSDLAGSQGGEPCFVADKPA